MSNGENGSLLSGYWAMNEEQRRERNREFLKPVLEKDIAAETRKKHLEKLLLHTLHGKVITEQLLDEPEYAEYREQLLGVMATLGEREEEIYTLQGTL
ncbi:MAG: hypothetical protein ACYDER_17800 [Ktedonobacteraceae bacterium]